MGCGLSLADKVRVKMGGGYYREEKIIEIWYAAIYVATTLK